MGKNSRKVLSRGVKRTEEDFKETPEDLRTPQLQACNESPKPKCNDFKERSGTPLRSQALPFSRERREEPAPRYPKLEEVRSGTEIESEERAYLRGLSHRPGCQKGGQHPRKNPPINGRCLRCCSKGHSMAECRRLWSDKRAQTPGKPASAEGWMDPDAVPLEEAEKGMPVTVYPSYPPSSFLSSAAQSLAAYPHNGEPSVEMSSCTLK